MAKKKMTLQAELKNEYKSFDSWYEQLSNIIYSFLWAFGTWLLITVTLFFSGIILSIIIWTGPLPAFVEIQTALRGILYFIGGISALLVILFGLPRKIRNVFYSRATQRIERYENIKNKFTSEVETTNSLLLKYGLITQDDIDRSNEPE